MFNPENKWASHDFSPTGQFVALPSDVVFWSPSTTNRGFLIESGVERRVPAGTHGATAWRSADDRLVAWPAQDGTIKVWNLKANEENSPCAGIRPTEGLEFSQIQPTDLRGQ